MLIGNHTGRESRLTHDIKVTLTAEGWNMLGANYDTAASVMDNVGIVVAIVV